MRTIRTKVYKFDELKPDAQNKVVELLRDINTDYQWWDETYEDFFRITKYFGIDVDLKNTWFTLQYSQSDGSSYAAKVDAVRLIQCIKSMSWKEYAPKENFSFPVVSRNVDRIIKLIQLTIIDIQIIVSPVNRETNIRIDLEENYSNSRRLENIETAIGELEQIVTTTCKELNRFLYQNLRNEYEYLSGRDTIIETIKANEYEFYQDGTIYHKK
jgi:hypothetical protein